MRRYGKKRRRRKVVVHGSANCHTNTNAINVANIITRKKKGKGKEEEEKGKRKK